MKTFSGILCLVLCFIACFGLPIKLPEDEIVEGDDYRSKTTRQLFKRSPSIADSKTQNSRPRTIDINILFQKSPKNNAAENRAKEAEYKIDELEQTTKINNVIFTNVGESEGENYNVLMQKVLHILNAVMNVKTLVRDIAVIRRLDRTNPSAPGPIVVTFLNFHMKEKVLAAKFRLRSIPEVKVSADYTSLVRQKRRELFVYVMWKRSLGMDAFLLYDKLYMNGVKVSLEELKAERKQVEAKEAEEISEEEERPETQYLKSAETMACEQIQEAGATVPEFDPCQDFEYEDPRN